VKRSNRKRFIPRRCHRLPPLSSGTMANPPSRERYRLF
jgi:hypothetical protein